MKRLTRWIFLGLLVIAAAACDPTTPTPGPVPTTWIDAPLPGSVLPLEPYKIVFHGASFTGISEFEVSINGVMIGSMPPQSTGSGGSQFGTLFYGEYLWTPTAPGTYLIAVQSKVSGGQPGTSQQVEVTVTGEGQVKKEPPPSVKPTATPIPQPCMLTARVNLLCRPGTGYEMVDSFYQGDSAEVIGQSQFLWKVIGVKSGKECTVPKDDTLVELSGDCDDLPEFIPLPTATPTLRPTPTPERGYTVRQTRGGVICVVPCPARASPGEPCTP